jgi:hypothetical protein
MLGNSTMKSARLHFRLAGPLLVIFVAAGSNAHSGIPQAQPRPLEALSQQAETILNQDPAPPAQAPGEGPPPPSSNDTSKGRHPQEDSVPPQPNGHEVDSTTKKKKDAAHSRATSPGAVTSSTAGQAFVQGMARQTLDDLDVSIDVATRLGALRLASPSEASGNDVLARRDVLRQMANSAKDDAAWAEVASGSSAALKETLNLIRGNPNGRAAAAASEARTGTANGGSVLNARQLPLFMASLSLVLSLAALAVGWLLARREVNKALIEAGLL